jgi:hypothetical protein
MQQIVMLQGMGNNERYVAKKSEGRKTLLQACELVWQRMGLQQPRR